MRLTAEQREIQDLAKDFAEAEIRPHTASWDEARELAREVFAHLGEMGFLGMLVPEKYGGLGLDVNSYLVALEALSWGDPSVALTVAIQNGPLAAILLDHGNEQQKETWLPRLASGEALGAFALSEPAAGSDAAALHTRAARDGDQWVLSGRKRWVTNGARADLVLVFAREGADASGPIAAFLVEPTASGYTVGRRERTMGLRASETVEISLDGVRMADDGRIPLSNDSFISVLRTLDLARLSDAALSLGIAQAAFEHATRYALEREQFGHAIADFGAIQAKLADMAARIAAARALTHEAGARFAAAREGEEAAEPMGTESLRASAAMAKLTASQAAMWVADEAVQVYGGYGYMRHYPVEKLLRDAKGTEILEGTSEIMRLAIAREVIKAAKEA